MKFLTKLSQFSLLALFLALPTTISAEPLYVMQHWDEPEIRGYFGLGSIDSRRKALVAGRIMHQPEGGARIGLFVIIQDAYTAPPAGPIPSNDSFLFLMGIDRIAIEQARSDNDIFDPDNQSGGDVNDANEDPLNFNYKGRVEMFVSQRFLTTDGTAQSTLRQIPVAVDVDIHVATGHGTLEFTLPALDGFRPATTYVLQTTGTFISDTQNHN